SERTRGYLGVMFEGDPNRGPVSIYDVLPDSPASKAGVMVDDVVLKVNKIEVKDRDLVLNTLKALKPGDKVTFRLKRGDKEMDVSITVGQWPADFKPSAKGDHGYLGVKLRSEKGTGTVVIDGVESESPAAEAGVKPGDTLLKVDDQTVESERSLIAHLVRLKVGDQVKLRLKRDKRELDVTITAGKRPADSTRRGKGGGWGLVAGAGRGEGTVLERRTSFPSRYFKAVVPSGRQLHCPSGACRSGLPQNPAGVPMKTLRYAAAPVCLVLGLALLPAARADDRPAPADQDRPRWQRLGKQVEQLRTVLKIPGMSAVVLRDQRVLWSKGFGFADTDKKIPATPETLYHVASLTKTLAATLLLQLAEQGKLDPDEPVSRYSAAFKDDAVRVKHLLSHTSEGTPGERYHYHGDRFNYLTAVLEKKTDKTFRQLVVETFLDPLGMAASVPGHDSLDQAGATLDQEHRERYRRNLEKFALPYTLYGTEVVRE